MCTIDNIFNVEVNLLLLPIAVLKKTDNYFSVKFMSQERILDYTC